MPPGRVFIGWIGPGYASWAGLYRLHSAILDLQMAIFELRMAILELRMAIFDQFMASFDRLRLPTRRMDGPLGGSLSAGTLASWAGLYRGARGVQEPSRGELEMADFR